MQDVSQGVERNRKWPEKRKHKLPDKTKEQNEWFRQAQWATKYFDPRIYTAWAEAVKGTPLLPRDIMTMIMSGRLCCISTVDGKVFFPVQARNDVSESLDAISQDPGYILVRGPVYWEAQPLSGVALPIWFVMPPDTGWTLANGSGTNLAIVSDANAGLSIAAGPPVAGDKSAIAWRPIVDKTLPWSLDVHLDWFVDAPNFSGVGIGVMDSIGGRLQTITSRGNAMIAINNWASLSAFGAGVTSMTANSTTAPNFWKIASDGTNITYSYSIDGVTYTQLATGSLTSYLANKPDRIVLVADYNRTIGFRNMFTVNRWVASGIS